MAKNNRIKQRGSEWFRTNANDTQKMQLATVRYGIKLKGLQTVLDMFICQNDYYYEITDDTYQTLESFYGCKDRAEIDELIKVLVDAGEYDSEIFEQYNILTNERIQDGFSEIGRQRVSSRRKSDADYKEPIYKELWLTDLKKKWPFFNLISISDDKFMNHSRTVNEQLMNSFEHRRDEDRREEDRIEEDRRGEDRRENRILTIAEIDSRRKSDHVDMLMHFAGNKLDSLAIKDATYRNNKSNIRQVLTFFCKAYELYIGKAVPDEWQNYVEEACMLLAEPIYVTDTAEVVLTIDEIDAYKKTIKKYFETNMECDYSLKHFLSGRIRLLAYQDAMREE